MRIFKGLENIHAVIDRHENEWRREHGEPEIPEYTPNEAARRRWAKITEKGKGKLDADRFLDKKPNEPEPELEPEQKFDSAPEVEVIEAIKQEGVQHSWLYNEVEKAVRAAVADDRKHTKVIAVFIPVIQNSKEFEQLPVDEKVTLPPVKEEIQEEDDSMPFEIVVDESASAPVEETQEEDNLEDSEPALGDVYEEPATEEPEETHDFNLIPEGQEHPDEELAEAFNTMEEKLSQIESELGSEVESLDTVTEEIHEESEEIPEAGEFEIIEDEDIAAATEAPETEVQSEEESFLEFEPQPQSDEENITDSDFTEEIPEEINEAPEPAEELTVVEEAPELNSEPQELEEPQEESDESGEPEEDSAGEAMTFEEFPVIKENENEAEDLSSDVDDLIEEVTPDDSAAANDEVENVESDSYADDENEEAKEDQEDEEEDIKYKAPRLEPPAIEDFDDDEVFEEPIELLDEEPEIEDGELLEDSDNIRIE